MPEDVLAKADTLPGGEKDGCRLGGHACFVATARCESESEKKRGS